MDERPYQVIHTVTEKVFTIVAFDAADALSRHIVDLQIQAGKILDLGLVRMHLSHLQVQGPGEPTPRPALDVLLDDFLKEING